MFVEGGDYGVFNGIYVFDYVNGLACFEDRVEHQLAGAVVGDASAAVDGDYGNAGVFSVAGLCLAACSVGGCVLECDHGVGHGFCCYMVVDVVL